jgi:hypothetical protein
LRSFRQFSGFRSRLFSGHHSPRCFTVCDLNSPLTSHRNSKCCLINFSNGIKFSEPFSQSLHNRWFVHCRLTY